MAELLMPKLSDTMEEGTVLTWLVADGEAVTKGQPLVEIETDKATMTVDAPEEGTLHVIAAEGEARDVGQPIAEIGGAGATAAPAAPTAETSEPEADADAEEAAVAPGAETAAEVTEEDSSTGIPTADDGTAAEIGADLGSEETYPGARAADEAEREEAEAEPEAPAAEPAPAEPAPSTANGAGAERAKASPLARRLAGELGVDIATVHGTGPDGRIVRADVEAAARGDAGAVRTEAPIAPAASEPTGPVAAPAADPAPAPAAEPGQRVPLTRLQRTVAQRMVASTTQAPQFTLQREVDAVELLALRRQLKDAAPQGTAPSVNDLIVKAVAVAAGERPDLVSRFDDDALVRPSGIHVGIAVAVEGGLLVPVIRDADTKGVGRIAAEARDLAARCRDGSITPAELEGSVISISNLGMFGIDRFVAIINPPEAAILAVGRAAARPVVREGAIVARQTMTLTLSVDHRALYGAEGAVLLGRIAELLERPGALVL